MIRTLLSVITISLALSCVSCQADAVPARLQTPYAPLNDKLSRTIRADEYAISPTEAQVLTNPIYLDAREAAEYQISHLPGALRIGYDRPDFSTVAQLDKDRPIVVYCTIGYRSERMVQRLKAKGFQQVYNLYGSIYAWSLAGLPLENQAGMATKKIHTYNRKWGTYFPHDELEVY